MRRRGPRRDRIGGIPFTSGIRAWLSWTLAPEMPTDKGRPVRSVIRWIFEPYLPRSTGFGPVRSPFSGPHVHRVDRAPRPVQVAAGAEFVQDQAVELGPYPGLRPLGEPAVGCRSGRPERRLRQLLPRAARGRHEHDRGQDLAVAVATPTATPAAATAPPAPPAGTTPTAHPVPAAQLSPHREATDLKWQARSQRPMRR